LEKERGLLSDRIFLAGIAVSSLAFLLVVAVPFVGSAAVLFVPQPILYYYSTTGRLKGFAILVLALLASFVVQKFLGGQVNFPLLILLGLLGIVLAEVLRRNYPVEKTVLHSVAALLLLGAFLLVYQCLRAGDNPWHLIGAAIAGKVRESIVIYTQFDSSSEQAKLIRENAAQIIQFLEEIFPAIVFVIASVAVWLNILVARQIFERNAVPFPEFGDLNCWKPPEKLIWLPIAAGIMILLPEGRVQLMGINMLIVSLFVYLLGGLAIVGYFFSKKNAPPILRFLFYFLIFAQQYMTMLVIAAGLFDLWIDFRRFNKTTEDPAT
jgi:uncharacterized protein YybS (DUF2232 family)